MPTIEILVGPPASGKTTYAFEKRRDGFVRINKDALRWMMLGVQYDEEREHLINSAYMALLDSIIWKKRNAVLDATHLRPGDLDQVKNFIKSSCVMMGATEDYEVIVVDKFCYVPEEELLKRDAARALEQQVGSEVIRKMTERVDAYLKEKADHAASCRNN